MVNAKLEQEINQLHANFCSGLSDATRLLILYTLSERPYTVNDLAASLSISQPATSRHLKVLRELGMVSTTRLGSSIEYSLADVRVIQALDLLRSAMRDHLAQRMGMLNVLDQLEPES
jgi:ArsR family transcriptional regulator